MSRPASERSPTVPAEEGGGREGKADIFESYMADPSMWGPPRMAHLILAVAFERARYCGLNNLTDGRLQLAKWMRSVSDLPSMQRTAPS